MIRAYLAILVLSFCPSARAQSGSLDTSFDPGTGANGNIFTTLVQPDGKVIIGGEFTSVDGMPRNRIARLNADGSLDASFDPGTGAQGMDAVVLTTVLQPDGRVIIGGAFSTYNGTPRQCIARLHSDGSLDTGFGSANGADNYVNTLALQPDGMVIMGGYFTTYNGTVRNQIARLHPDGTLDPTFSPGQGPNFPVLACAIQADGKIIIGGMFYTYGGVEQMHIARINPDATLDATFNPGLNGYVLDIAIQQDGKIIIGGEFYSFDGSIPNHVARLYPDGNFDTTFEPGWAANDYVHAVGFQADGKVIIGGQFISHIDTDRAYLARLNADGTLDASFDTGAGPDYHVHCLAVQPDGAIVVGGAFSSYDGSDRGRIARVHGSGTTAIDAQHVAEDHHVSLWPNPNNGRFALSYSGQNTEGLLEVLDMQGRMVHQARLAAWSQVHAVGLEAESAGVYQCRLNWGDRRTTVRVMVEP